MATRLTAARLRQIIKEEVTRVTMQETREDDGTFKGAVLGGLKLGAENRQARADASSDPDQIAKAKAYQADAAMLRAFIERADLTKAQFQGASLIHNVLQKYFGLTQEAAAMVLGSFLSSI
jgi:uncharacterized protein YjbI with pentapeptide repeats